MNTLFCFDLDGTLTRRELLPLIAAEVGLEHEFDVLTKLTIDGVISFEESLRLRFAILKTISIDKVQNVIAEAELFKKLIYFIKERKDSCYVVTGNLDVWISPLMQSIGCNYLCSKTKSDGDKLISLDYIMHKGQAISKLRQLFPNRSVVAIGDGNNDYEMFEAADKSISVGLTHNPSPNLIAVSDYIVYHEDSLCRLLNTL